MSHLGERLTALVDGELGHAERERALAHLASCDACRGEADILRRLKRRVHDLPGPGPSTGLLGTLLDLAGQQEPPMELTGGFPRTPLPLDPAAQPGRSLPPAAAAAAFLGLTDNPPLGSRPFGTASGGRNLSFPGGRRLSARSLVVGAFSLAAVTVGSALLTGGGGGGTSAPAVSPPARSFAVEHALSTGHLGSGGATSGVPAPRAGNPAQPLPQSATHPAAFRSTGP